MWVVWFGRDVVLADEIDGDALTGVDGRSLVRFRIG